ncbi:LuxR C-terminal-related transcriptional regulator [Streptomyces sp. NPDC086080]|uniref:helix-turn-helix transcriptional regulator n=1 Tax=Streptomyces sp. NPDC086080 TaxID=3365748 RepID=UPI0037D1DEA0
MSPPSRAAGERSRLLERAAEAAALRSAVREVAQGGSATVVVHGPPGSGRSAVLAVAAATARRAGLHVVEVRGDSAASHDGRDAAAAPTARDRPRAPLAVVADDAQWADLRSAPWHTLLARPLDDRPTLRVVAGGDPSVLPRAEPRRYELALRPLSGAAVRTLLTDAYGEAAGDALVPAAVAATGGTPAVLCAVLRRWPAPAPDAEDFMALAEQLGRHRLRRVLDRLPAHVVALVRASAVAAGDFSPGQVHELAEVPPSLREQALAELRRTGLLSAAAPPRPYHPLVAELVAEQVLGLMDEADRRALYERAVRLGRREGAPEAVLGRLVAHTRLAEPWVPAALYAAGESARRSGDDAAAFFERALDRGASGALRTKVLLGRATVRSPGAPEAADRALRRVLAETDAPDLSADRLLAADLLTLRGGDRTAAALASAAARDTTTPAERRTLLALREVALEAGPATGSTPAEAGPPQAGPPAATTPAQATPPQAGPATESTSAEATPPQAGPVVLAAAPAPAPPGPRGPVPGTPPDHAPAYEPLAAEDGVVAWRNCVAGRGIHQARRLAAGVFSRAGTGMLAPALAAARALAVAEDVDGARDGLARIEAEARRRGVGTAVALARLNRAELALRLGDLATAGEQLAECVAEMPRAHWPPRALPRLIALEALLALESGRPDAAESVLAGYVPHRYEYGLGRAHLLYAHGVLGLRTGLFHEARAQLRECGRMLLALGCRNPAVVPWRSHLAMAEATADPGAAARLLADDLAAARAWSAPGTIGLVHLWTGLTLTGPGALRSLRTAVRVLGDSAARARYAQAMAELATALLADGQSAHARRVLDGALAVSRAGARPVPRVKEVAAHFASLPRTSLARLSPAQRRVAILAAEGRSNRAIAEALSVSLRMVEAHLTNTYRALGVKGRTDLAAVLGHGGGPGEPPGSAHAAGTG